MKRKARIYDPLARIEASRKVSTVHALFNRLEDNIHGLKDFSECDTLSEEQEAEWKRRYGARESEVSMTIKLVNSLAKIIPLEEQVMKTLESIKNKQDSDITKNDVKIIRNYLEKVRDMAEHRKRAEESKANVVQADYAEASEAIPNP